MINIYDEVIDTIFNVGIYIRLSKEDLEKDDNKDSLSIENQRSILMEYINKKEYKLIDIYIDDGYTGTNFNRPAFKKMISDIENNKINMVITKDLSRLGRDYIQTGEFVEKYFPLHNVRYVALLDGIDTFIDSSSNDIAPFKAVINDMYSKDNSKKIRASLKSMQKEGKWVGGCTPLGYMKDPNDKNHLVPNPREASIVKEIFRLAIKGMTCYQIKEKLTIDNVPTMCILRNNNRVGEMSRKGIWNSKTIKSILTNQVYIGDLVQNKKSRISYKVRKMVNNDKDEWIIVKNTHESLIDKETFYKVGELLSNCHVKSNKTVYRLLDGILTCADCKHKISICKKNKYGKTYIVCNYYRMYSKRHVCTSHAFNYDLLEMVIINKIKEIIDIYINEEIFINKIKSSYEKLLNKDDLYIKVANIKKEIIKKNNQKRDVYLDKLNGYIDFNMYESVSNKLDCEINKLEIELTNLSKQITKRVNEDESKKIFNNFRENISRELILKLIKRIEIHDDKSIDIYFNFKKFNHN